MKQYTMTERTEDYHQYLAFSPEDFVWMETLINKEIEDFKSMSDEKNHNYMKWYGFDVYCDYNEFFKGYEDSEEEPLIAEFDTYKDLKGEFNTFIARIKFSIKSDGRGKVSVDASQGCYLEEVTVKEEEGSTLYVNLF